MLEQTVIEKRDSCNHDINALKDNIMIVIVAMSYSITDMYNK